MKNMSLSDTNSRFFHRQTLRIPNKIVSFKNFSNQRLIDKVTSRPNRQENGSKKITERIIPFVLNKKQDANSKHILSYDDFIQTKNTFARILKFTTLSGQSGTPKSYKLRSLTLSRKIKSPLNPRIDSSRPSENKKNLQTSILHFKRELEERFECTRLLFKEENRLKTINKLNSLRRKRKQFQNINKSEEISAMMRSSSKEKYSPWMSKRRASRDIYEAEEGGEGEELLLNFIE